MRYIVHLSMVTLLSVMTGCDDRAAEIAREAADRQAEQNTTMTNLNKEVSRGSRELVTADSRARQEILAVHRELQSERTRLDASREEVESERKQLAAQRQIEPLLATVLSTAGCLAVTLLALGFCWRALVRVHNGTADDAELNEILMAEVLEVDPPLMFRETPAPLQRHVHRN